jgi:hypothetical protein
MRAFEPDELEKVSIAKVPRPKVPVRVSDRLPGICAGAFWVRCFELFKILARVRVASFLRPTNASNRLSSTPLGQN